MSLSEISALLHYTRPSIVLPLHYGNNSYNNDFMVNIDATLTHWIQNDIQSRSRSSEAKWLDKETNVANIIKQ